MNIPSADPPSEPSSEAEPSAQEFPQGEPQTGSKVSASTPSESPSTAQNGIERVIIYTDGAAEPNPGPGGYGVVLKAGLYRKELSGGFRKTTNNRMELMAVIVALESLKRSCRVLLYSDSKYVVDSVQRGSVVRWKSKGWKRGPGERVKNVDLWQRFLIAYGRHNVEFRWVKGHAGIAENERCDELAVAAAQGYDLPIDEGYLAELAKNGAPIERVLATHQDDSQSGANATTSEGNTATDEPPREGGPCRACGKQLIRKTTKPKAPKPGQEYCYDWYLFCSGCNRMYMVEEGKRYLS